MSKVSYLCKTTKLSNGGELIIYSGNKSCYKYCYLNGVLHREDGPAVEDAYGTKYWFINGYRHREDGPAIEWKSGKQEWWLNGKLITTIKEFSQLIKLKGFW